MMGYLTKFIELLRINSIVMNEDLKKICVVGAGPSGLVSAKYALEYGYKCDVYEQSDTLGGNWVYTDCTDANESGMYVNSSLYKSLISNVPKEIMEFAGLKFPNDFKESYIHHTKVLKYLQLYAEKYRLGKCIQYCHLVIKITPTNDRKWLVTVRDMKNKSEQCMVYHYIFVCNGRFKQPNIPKIFGQDIFQGLQIHSRKFRVPDLYREQEVLVVGGYHSAQEISMLISTVAKHVILSCRKSPRMANPSNLMEKPEVVQFTRTAAIFIDGSIAQIDTVVYCTGYLYSCNFITDECGVKVENNGIAPLYKQIINIENPTMFFIGIPYMGSGNVLFDLQVRFAMATLTEKFMLPTKENMLKEWNTFLEMKDQANIPRNCLYKLDGPDKTETYAMDLATTANITPIPPVVYKIYRRVVSCNGARCSYRIIDDESFEEIVV